MTKSDKYLSNLSTDELVAKFQEASLQGQPSQELVNELSRRPGVALINATDSTATTLEIARSAIKQIEQSQI